MPGKKQLSADSRRAIVRAKEAGRTDRKVAEEFGVDYRTIARTYARFEDSQSVERKRGSGRPRKSTERQDRSLVKLVKQDPKKNAIDVLKYANETLGLKISGWTARRILTRAKLFARRPAKKPLVSDRNRKARLAFARQYQFWTSADWSKVLWSDESKFNLFSSDGIHWVRRPPGTRYDPKYQVPTVKHGADL